MKKKLFLLAFIFLFSKQLPALPFGLGIMVGEPTGISVKVQDFAFGIGWNLDKFLHVHGDYWLLHKAISAPFYFYLGPGVKLQIASEGSKKQGNDETDLGLSVRFPVGVQLMVLSGRIDIFLEAVPELQLLPSTNFDVEAALGARYFF